MTFPCYFLFPCQKVGAFFLLRSFPNLRANLDLDTIPESDNQPAVCINSNAIHGNIPKLLIEIFYKIVAALYQGL